MTKRVLGTCSILPFAFWLLACETTSSTDLKTSGIDAEILVMARDSASSEVHVTLLPGGDDDPFNRVELNGGDALYGEVAGERKKLSESGLGNYEATFATAAADTEFVISLERALEEDKDAPRSAGTLPSPFALDALAKTEFSRAEDLTVQWSPSGFGDAMSLEIDGNCITASSGRLSIPNDTGSFTVSANQLEALGSDAAETCQATLTITRLRRGRADDALNKESSVTLQQVRSTSFSSTP